VRVKKGTGLFPSPQSLLGGERKIKDRDFIKGKEGDFSEQRSQSWIATPREARLAMTFFLMSSLRHLLFTSHKPLTTSSLVTGHRSLVTVFYTRVVR